MTSKDDERAGELRADVGDMVKRIRRAAGMSERELAGLLGVSRSTVVRYESGEAAIPADAIPTLVHALRIDPWLFVTPPRRRVEVAAAIEDYLLRAREEGGTDADARPPKE